MDKKAREKEKWGMRWRIAREKGKKGWKTEEKKGRVRLGREDGMKGKGGIGGKEEYQRCSEGRKEGKRRERKGREKKRNDWLTDWLTWKVVNIAAVFCASLSLCEVRLDASK